MLHMQHNNSGTILGEKKIFDMYVRAIYMFLHYCYGFAAQNDTEAILGEHISNLIHVYIYMRAI